MNEMFKTVKIIFKICIHTYIEYCWEKNFYIDLRYGRGARKDRSQPKEEGGGLRDGVKGGGGGF